ncbi:ABC transporter substrate-binding protein [Streptomyces sp. NPDC101115]|uniref:ABC transporter substrate-binding protein n=1 Tax=Streptomyces sp. NPDC101115 TaxID=3366106 RepID=UPI00381A14D0
MSRTLRTLAAAAAALFLATACNSASTGGTSVKPGASGGTVRGVTADTVRVGGIVSMTSASGYSKKDTDLGARARYDRANAEGGVNGRRIEYLGAEDDGQDPARNLAAARRLVQQEKVFAVAPMSSVTFAGADFLDSQAVPTVGWGTLPSFCGPKHIYGFNGCLVPTPGGTLNQTWPEGLATVLGGAKGRSVALIAGDNDAGKFGIRTFTQGFKAAGFDLAYAKAAVPAGSLPSDWSAYTKEILRSGPGGKAPDAVVSVMQTPYNIGLFTALKRAGYEGVLSDPTDYDPGLLAKDATRQALDGVLVLLQFQPFEADGPAMRQFKADIRKAAGKEVPLNMHMMTGYMSADLFLAVAARAGKDLTVESFQKAANGFSDTGTLVGDRAEPKGQKESFGCGALVRLTGGRYEVAVPFRCYPPIPFR